MHRDPAEDDGVVVLDLRHLRCPLPVLRTRKALRRLPLGRTVVVLCTDPWAMIDIPHLLRETGDVLDDHVTDEAGSRFTIRRVGPSLAEDPMTGACVDARRNDEASKQ